MGFAKFARERLFKRTIIDAFHNLWYDSPETWLSATFLGFGVKQYPGDLFIYQQIIHANPPPFILQTGVSDGGSIVFFATLLDLIKAPPSAIVIGIDIELNASARRIDHPRVRLLEASSVDPATLDRVKAMLPAPAGMVSLDSDHAKDHVLKELIAYAPFVAKGAYLVCEDTNVNGNPVHLGHGPGPYEAVQEFLKGNADFAHDPAVVRGQLMSFHEHGWLKRVR
jgi:cephalosporin hydroxylase